MDEKDEKILELEVKLTLSIVYNELLEGICGKYEEEIEKLKEENKNLKNYG